jgi:octaheme c-type cytochrome (tetrathionate reductase family)
MKNTLTFVLSVVVPLVIITLVLQEASQENTQLAELKEKHSVPHIPGVDHSKHEVLQRDFENPHEITAACLSCHTERGDELLHSFHFTWEREEFIEGRGVTYLGKKNLLNNFCTGIFSNESSCNRCHAGYGWGDNSFDFSNPYNIDCLVCHDNTGTYEKARGGAGYPNPGQDFRSIVQNVGLPTKANCGYCHFHGGGGNNVKHGDLEMALLTASREVDVHMGVDGGNMDCVDCHTAPNHKMTGRYYGVSSSNTNRVTCEQCHTATPHIEDQLNSHVAKIACQTCHIPEYAKVNPTKMYWDWSTAGELKDGKAFELYDSKGNTIYQSIKGDASWQTNVVPEYSWFNGTADHFLLSDKVDTTAAFLRINTLFGSADDPESRIIPSKVHRGRQPFDPVHLTILQAKLWDREPGKGALWLDLDWERSLIEGMKYLDRPYSGQWDFVDTEMYLPVNHMVSPAEQALTCEDCHTRIDSRMQFVEGTYIPGFTTKATIDNLGVLLIILSLLGVITHAIIRYISIKKLKTPTA